METKRKPKGTAGRLLKLLGLFCCLALQANAQTLDVGQLIVPQKGYAQNRYPDTKSIVNFTVMYPGIALVPAGGGVFMAGWQKWFLKPSQENMTFTVDYCEANMSFYFFTTNKNKTKSILLKLTENEQNPYAKVVEMPLGVYGLKAVSADAIWIWGQQGNEWCIWKYDSEELILVSKTDRIIRDIAPVNEDNILVATDHSIITMGINRPANEIIKMDLQVDGLCIDTDGTVFVSTEKGVLHYLSAEYAEDAEIVTYGIHGKLKRYQKSIFVLWKEENQVLEIKL